MNIYDCFLFTDENLILNLRLKILNDFVDKFVICETNFYHSGKEKSFNFNINNFSDYKNKIIYIKVNELPKFTTKDLFSKRTNFCKIIGHQRNKLLDGLSGASKDDFILYSDIDEIPKLDNFDIIPKKKIIIFQQKLFYYKFNFLRENVPWFGTRCCKKKDLINFEWMRQIKPKKYNKWRIDTFLRKDKYMNIKIVEDGGWHFSQIMSAERIYEKLLNDEHHDEFELSGIKLEDISKMIKEGIIAHDHSADKKDVKSKWSKKILLKKIDLNLLPQEITINLEKYQKWVDQ